MNRIGTLILVAVLAIVPLAALCALALGVAAESVMGFLTTSSLAVGMAYAVQDRDARLRKTKALSGDSSASVSDGIDLGHSSAGLVPGDMELLITAPAMAVGELANTETLKYTLQHDSDPAFGTVATLLPDLIVQTGAGGAGAAGATKQVRLPSNTKRYIRVSVAASESKDKSAKSFSIQVIF